MTDNDWKRLAGLRKQELQNIVEKSASQESKRRATRSARFKISLADMVLGMLAAGLTTLVFTGNDIRLGAIPMVGVAAVGYSVCTLILMKINTVAADRSSKRIIMKTAVMFGFVVLSFLGVMSLPKGISTSSPIAPSQEMKDVITFSTSQRAEGATEADLNQGVLAYLEDWTRRMMLQKGQSYYGEMGHDPNKFRPDIESSSVYVTVEGRKLAVIKIRISNVMQAVTIVGLEGNEFLRVNCIRGSDHDIPVWFGECGEKVHDVFGVRIQG